MGPDAPGLRQGLFFARMMFFRGGRANWNGEPFEPGWLLRDNPALPTLRRVEEFAHLRDFIEKKLPRTIFLHRTHAMGDILMLFPVARAIHRHCRLSAPIIIGVGARFFTRLSEVKQTDPRIRLTRAMGVRDYNCDVHIDLDSVLEKDHEGGAESDVDRVKLYADFLGFPL